jgi:hypothetical protein
MRLIASTMSSFSFVRRGSAAVLWFVMGVSAVVAQDKPPILTARTSSDRAVANLPDLSKEALVFDQCRTRIHMDADGTGTRETTARIRILADAGVKAMAVLPITYSTSNQQVDIAYVRVRKPDGSLVVTPEYNVQDMPADVSREAPLYSDIHQKHVAVRGLGVGDTLEYQVTLRTLKPEVPGQFWLEYSFEKNVVVLDEQLDLDVPAEMSVTVASSDVQPTTTAASGRKLYHWVSSNLTHPDPKAVPKKHWKPSVQVTTFTSWEQVGAWYQSLQRNSLAISPAIQAHADALTRGLTTDDDKVRAIANDVALHIHYVGLDFGIGRYRPHAADDVLANEYGDCKDKHTLLAAMLKAVGIDAWPALISSQRDLDPTVPSPAQFDHVITLVPKGNSFTWIDSTAEVAPIGTLMPNLRDKQALAIPSSSPASLEHTPAQPPSPGSIRINVVAQLSDRGLLKGHITQTTSGDLEMLFRLAFRRAPQSQWKDLVHRIVLTQGYGGEASNPQVSDVEQIGGPFVISFDYTREKYYEWDESRATHWISPPLPPIGGELAPGTKEKKPDDNPTLGSIGRTVYHADLRLPPGWTVTPPKDVHIAEDWLEYRATYSFKEGVFTAERSISIKKPEVPLGQWERYLAFRHGMFEDWNREVLIHPGNGTSAASAPTTASTGNSQGTVNRDSLPVYPEATKESDVVLTLARGTVVRVGLSVTTGDGMFCSIFNADTSEKLGFVHCDGLDRQIVPSTAADNSEAALTTSVDGTSHGTSDACNGLERDVVTGQLSEVESTLETEPNLVNCRGLRGFTPLHMAADRGQTEVAKVLIKHGAEINARTDAGETPLHWAAFDRRINAVTLLLAEGAEINPRDKDGSTPLHWAAARGHIEIAELLIAHGADLKAKTYSGCTPLRGAYDYHQAAMVRVLQHHGATQ